MRVWFHDLELLLCDALHSIRGWNRRFVYKANHATKHEQLPTLGVEDERIYAVLKKMFT